jgi:hypothetical protein
MAPMCFISVGNYSRMVSCPTWRQCVSYRQETIRVWFPVRLGTDVFHISRKLFAYGFLFGLGQMCFIPTGNCLRMISYSAWDRCFSYRQETICIWFPVRLVANAFHIGRKLPGEKISGLRFAALEMTGRRYTMVFHAHRKLSHYPTVPLSHCPTISLAHQLTSPLPPTQTVRPAGFCFFLLLW